MCTNLIYLFTGNNDSWPGFDMAFPHESLWDEQKSEVPCWTNTEVPPPPPKVKHMSFIKSLINSLLITHVIKNGTSSMSQSR